ncbi:MAG: hypothetical protein ISS15_02820 [Alphaproteobacteria bacterium]|nr:hypothetical protein [Alphaproteobacteria bacterium]MBL6938508.1 hypothetical protein [Alphaproteobacteria bacterium]MBL7096567.1 hypothetical protein [Alphaproteobacteria bacterium]
MSSEASELGVGVARGRATIRTRGSFFFIAHVMLLIIVLLGFAPSFYLRAAFHHTGPLPALLYVHGTALTVWFVLTVVQGWLMRSHRSQLHQQLGYYAAAYAAVVIVLGVLANLMLISQIDSPADGENIVVWGNFFALAIFATLVSLAVVFRKKPDAHKRLMLLASISIVGPALARLPRWPIFAGGLEAGRNYAIGGLLVMLALLLIYDVIVRKKPHRATWGGALVILGTLVGAVFLGLTGIGYHLLHG